MGRDCISFLRLIQLPVNPVTKSSLNSDRLGRHGCGQPIGLRNPEQYRVIWLDRNKPSPGASRMGHSVGWYEGDDLWVETTDFLTGAWGTYSGVDSSDQKHLLERFRVNPDGLSMSLLVTITDPVYLTEPVVIDYPLSRMEDRPFVNAPCTLESAKLFMEGGY